LEIEDAGATPFEQLGFAGNSGAVQAALAQVPDVFRSAVILPGPRGLSYEEVAEVLEASSAQ